MPRTKAKPSFDPLKSDWARQLMALMTDPRLGSAEAIKGLVRIAERGLAIEARLWRARRQGGIGSATTRWRDNDLHGRNKKILLDAAKLVTNDQPRREVAGILARKYNLSATQIRAILKKAKAS